MVVDRYVDVLPAQTARTSVLPEPLAAALTDPSELLDVEVDQVPRLRPFVAADLLFRDSAQTIVTVQPEATRSTISARW